MLLREREGESGGGGGGGGGCVYVCVSCVKEDSTFKCY